MNFSTELAPSEVRTGLPRWLVVGTIGFCISPLFFYFTGIPLELGHTPKSDNAWHMGIEMAGVMFGLLAAALSVVYFNIRKDVSVLVIGLGSGGASCFDLYHALLYSDLVSFGTAGVRFRASSAIISRLFIPILLLSGAYAGKYLSKANGNRQFKRTLLFVSALYAAAGFLLLQISLTATVSYQLFFPDRIISRPYDGMLALGLHAFAFRETLALHRRENTVFSATIMLVQLPMVMALMALTFKGTIFSEDYFVFAHLFKVFAYALPFSAICWEFVDTYRNAERFAAQSVAKAANMVAEREAALEEQIARRESAESVIAAQNIKMIQSSKLAALGEVAGGIAHEINTPLAVIKLNAEQLMESIEHRQFEPGLLKEKLRDIDLTTDRIARIVRSLRTVSRNGNNDPIERVSAAGVFRDVRDLCEEKLRNNSIQLTMVSAEDIFVDCRPTELSQVILNLVQNSCDAISSLEDRWIMVIASESRTEVTLSIIDSGNGIPAMIRNRILQPFFTTKEVGKGTGLGLSISKSIMESYGGSLDLDESHENTKFVLRIPKRKAGGLALAASAA